MPEHLFGRTLMRRAIGHTKLDRCAPPVRELHDVGDAIVVYGRTTIERGRGPVPNAIAWLFGFPRDGRKLDTVITILRERGREIWHRRFAGTPIVTYLEPHAAEATVIERFRFGVTFDLAVRETNGALHFEVRRMHLGGIPLPRLLWPMLDAQERARGNRFRFDIDIGLRGFGRLIRYRGWVRAV